MTQAIVTQVQTVTNATTSSIQPEVLEAIAKAKAELEIIWEKLTANCYKSTLLKFWCVHVVASLNSMYNSLNADITSGDKFFSRSL